MQQLKINSPATLVEGESYIVRLAVTNRSTKAGVPVGATLGVGISSSVDGLYLIPEQIADEYFAPNETRTFDYTMVVPSGSGGHSGTIAAWIQDPTGRMLAQGTKEVFIEALPPPECTPGETKCVGYDLYTCGADEKWQLTEENSTQCGYTPPECTEGELTCIGPHLYECVAGKWVLTWAYAPHCEKG